MLGGVDGSKTKTRCEKRPASEKRAAAGGVANLAKGTCDDAIARCSGRHRKADSQLVNKPVL